MGRVQADASRRQPSRSRTFAPRCGLRQALWRPSGHRLGVRLAWRSIVRRPGRAALAATGVALAIALAVTMFSLTEGVRASTRDLVGASGIDVFLYPEGTNPLLAGNPNAPAGELAGGRRLAAAVEADEGVRIAAPMLHEPLYVIAPGGLSDANALGFIPRTTQEFIAPTFRSGRGMATLDDPMYEADYDPAAATGELVMNENLAATLGVVVGDAVRLSLSPAEPTNGLVFTIVGIAAPEFESPQEKTVYLHLAELQWVAQKHERDAVDFLGVKLAAGADASEVAQRLEAAHPVEPFTNDDLVREVGVLTATFEGFAQMIGLVTLGVALLFVSTVMMIVVNERTPELAALRAIGMPPARIFRLVLAEAALLVALASILGFALGWFGAQGFDAFLRHANAERTPAGFRYTRLSLGLLLQVTGLTALMALLAGLLPAWRASRLNLLEALRSV